MSSSYSTSARIFFVKRLGRKRNSVSPYEVGIHVSSQSGLHRGAKLFSQGMDPFIIISRCHVIIFFRVGKSIRAFQPIRRVLIRKHCFVASMKFITFSRKTVPQWLFRLIFHINLFYIPYVEAEGQFLEEDGGN